MNSVNGSSVLELGHDNFSGSVNSLSVQFHESVRRVLLDRKEQRLRAWRSWFQEGVGSSSWYFSGASLLMCLVSW